MKLFDLLAGVEYEMIKGRDREISNVYIDSRKVTEGSLFICIEGFASDGHKYAAQSAEKGAAAILVTKDIDLEPLNNVSVIKVSDSRSALSYIAGNFYNNVHKKMTMIGVTGTNGKTSITYFMEAVLNKAGLKNGVIGTVSTRIGEKELGIEFATSTTPDPMELHEIFNAMYEQGVQYVIMEATSHAMELHKLDGMSFNTAILTNITQDHLDLHGSMENYKKAKGKLFENSFHSVINADDAAGGYMMEKAKGDILTYSIDNESGLKAENVVYSALGVKFDIAVEGLVHHFEVPIPGRFTVYNALGTIGAALKLGIDIEVIKEALRGLKGVPGRIQSVENDKGFSVIVDYAHTPDGLTNIISAVREFTKGRVITIFGCGGDRDNTKRPIMGEIAGRLSDYCIITSDNPRSENPDAIIEQVEAGLKDLGTPYVKMADRREAIFHGVKTAQKGDSVIIAGKGHEDYQIFPHGTVHFDDVEVAAEALDSIN